MRYQGRITDWKDDRGFGFITPNGGTEQVFVHISAFVQRKLRPDVDQLVTYALVADSAKGCRAEDVKYAAPRDAGYFAPRDIGAIPEREPFFKQFVFVVIAVAAGLYGWEHYQARSVRGGSYSADSHSAADHSPATPGAKPSASGLHAIPNQQGLSGSTQTVRGATTFHCEDKRYCSQMTSCAEASFYLKNCPGAEMDDDRDGVPCESQWCSR